MRNKLLLLISAVAAACTLTASELERIEGEVAVPFPSFEPPRAQNLAARPIQYDFATVAAASDSHTPAAPAPAPGAGPAGGYQLGLGSAGPITVAVPTAVPMAPAQAAIAIVVPLVIALLKKWLPLHKASIPYISFGIGAALGIIDSYTGVFGGNPLATTLLGPAGTGLREIYAQTRNLLVAPEPPATA